MQGDSLVQKDPDLSFLFSPRSIAVVGGSTGMAPYFLTDLVNKGFEGEVYSVNPNREELVGLKCYPTLTDVPDPLDYVIVAVSAQLVPSLLTECAAKNVKACTIFSAGFSELGTEEGRRLEQEIVDIAGKNGLRIIGPNCMGIYCPSTGLHFSTDLEDRSGSLGLICQSGTVATYLSRAAPLRGACINKAVSYGNACDINESDLLEHYTEDGDVEVIAAYIEGVKDGRRFLEALKKAARTKPTIVLKGGKTEAGIATAASHTGALSSSIQVWNAIMRQSGAIPADHLDQLVDLSLLFLRTPPCVGRRIGMVGLGGGVSVLASDAFETFGFTFPDLSGQIKAGLLKLSGAPGSIFKNPVDTPIAFKNPDATEDVLRMLDEWDEVDLLLIHHGYDIPGGGRANLSPAIGRMIDAARVVSKPAALVLYCTADPGSYEASVQDQQRGWEAGVPSFDSMESAAAALHKFISYHERKARRHGST
jgi:acyl-CoA synthetase (NDP forming)